MKKQIKTVTVEKYSVVVNSLKIRDDVQLEINTKIDAYKELKPTSYQNEESIVLQATYNFINNKEYAKALKILEQLPNTDKNYSVFFIEL